MAMLSVAIEVVQFSVSFVTSLPVFDEICGMAMNSVLFSSGNTKVQIRHLTGQLR